MEGKGTYNYLENYLNSLRAKGRYAFSWDELKKKFDDQSDKALNQNLFRLKKKKKIEQVRKEYYAIIPPEYAIRGMIPLSLFIDDMMKALNHRYYIGLASAASLHGAAHQQPMESSVITNRPALRAINNDMLKVHFYTKIEWEEQDIQKIKTDAGYINVSSPELTALDFFYYINSIGLSRVITILSELIEVIKPGKLASVASRYSQTAAIQRLGYILDMICHNDKLSNSLSKVLAERLTFQIPLIPGKKIEGVTNPKWKIIVNAEIDTEQ